MKQISAAENLNIDMDLNRWRLTSNGDGSGEQVILEASSGQPLRYLPSFAMTRRLPPSGMLPTEYVRHVVVGWSFKDEAWHLGLLLARDLAEPRGSRWCEIAYWPDPDTTVFAEMAREAGEMLAQTLARPFDLIPPRPRPVEAPPPLPELPLHFGVWSLEQSEQPDVLQFRRSHRWVVGRLTRATWYAFWAVVYVILSITTLETDLALPNAGTMLPSPQLLPYLGLVAAAVLVIMILYIFYEFRSKPDIIRVDPRSRTVTALRAKRECWQYKAENAQSVYVTQVVSKKGKNEAVHHAELNLHLGSGKFHQIVQQPQPEDVQLNGSEPSLDEQVVPLTRSLVHTDLQAAAMYVASVLGNLPCWYDQRVMHRSWL